jgi:hypothetical protein
VLAACAYMRAGASVHPLAHPAAHLQLGRWAWAKDGQASRQRPCVVRTSKLAVVLSCLLWACCMAVRVMASALSCLLYGSAHYNWLCCLRFASWPLPCLVYFEPAVWLLLRKYVEPAVGVTTCCCRRYELLLAAMTAAQVLISRCNALSTSSCLETMAGWCSLLAFFLPSQKYQTLGEEVFFYLAYNFRSWQITRFTK